MCFTVNGEMQLTPDTAAFLAMLFDFPLAFTEDLQPGGINYQVCDFTPGGRFETDINRLCPPADTAPCAARRVSLNTRLMTSTVVMARSE